MDRLLWLYMGSNSGMLLAGEIITLLIISYLTLQSSPVILRMCNSTDFPGQSNDVSDISDDPNTAQENDATIVDITQDRQ